MNKDFECSICLDKLDEPITLCSNHHNYCLDCINDYFNVGSGKNVRCPLCRESVDLSKGVELKKNQYLENLLNYIKKNEEKFKMQEEDLKFRQDNVDLNMIEGENEKIERSVERKFKSRYLKDVTFEEFNKISKYLLDSFLQEGKDGKIYQVVIQEIKKYCNPELALKFHKEKLKFQKQRIRPNITMMTHGTTLQAVKGISTEGFRLPTSNIRKDDNEPYMFGKAVYFSPLTNKCTQYGANYLVVASLLLGKVYKTKEFKYDMELKKLKELGGYTSIHCLGDSKNTGGVEYEEVAIYRKEQILPLFAIRYQLVENKLGDIETFKLDKEYHDEDEKFKAFFEKNPKLIDTLTKRLYSGNVSVIEQTVKLIGDLSKYKGSRFRLWYEVSLSEDIYKALRYTVMESKNELILWEAMRAIWGITYGNLKGQRKFLTYGGENEGRKFMKRIVHNFKHHSNRTVKQRSAVMLCNFSQGKENRKLIEQFGAVRGLFTVMKAEVSKNPIDLKLIVNILGALANLSLDYWKKFTNNDKFYLEQMLNNRKLTKINEEILRCVCNLMFEGKVEKEWVNENNKYVSEKSSEFF